MNTNAPTPAQWASDNGFSPIPLRSDTKIPARKGWNVLTFSPFAWRAGELTGLRTGLQSDGSFLTVFDYDTNAAAHVQTLQASLSPATWERLFVTASTGGQGRHIYIRTARPVRSTWLYDTSGQKIGDIKSTGGQTVFPTRDRWLSGDLANVPMLTNAELDAVLQAVGYQDRAQRPTRGDEDVQGIIDGINAWKGRMNVLLTLDGLPRAFRNPNTPARRVLTGEHGPYKPGTRILDPSLARWIVAESLILHGYTDDRAAAILWHYGNFDHIGGESEKTRDAVLLDIARCIKNARAKHPNVKQRTSGTCDGRPQEAPAAVPQDIAHRTRARHDRPTKIALPKLLAWLRENADAGLVMLTRNELAQVHGVSYKTMKRLEDAARDAGLLTRHKSKDHHGSWLELRPASDVDQTENSTIAPDVDQTPQGITKPQNAIPHVRTCEGDTQRPDYGPPIAPPVAQVVAPVVVAPVPPAAAAVEARVSPQTPTAIDEPDEVEQTAAFPEVKRKRSKRPPLEDLPDDAARHAELGRRLQAVRGLKLKAKQIGHGSQFSALERQAEGIRKQIEALELEQSAAPPSIDMAMPLQLSLDGGLSGGVSLQSPPVDVPPAPRPTIASVIQMFYQCFGAGSYDEALTVVRPYPQLTDLLEKAQAMQHQTA